ncbi:MAG: CCA tRNA nucleotidyltransferase [Chloroflexota bacterium]
MLSDRTLRRLGQAFTDAGYELYAVGGCVRDLLLGRPTTDYDFTSDALPEATKKVLATLHPDALYAVGEKFGTIGAVIEGHRIEVTTFRGDVYTPEGKRHPEVTFGVGLADDLARRDLTINAMAYRLSDSAVGGGVLDALVDPFGGRADLGARLIRAVGDAPMRFREDPLRLLRAVRFATTLGFTITPETEAAIHAEAPRLAEVSRERIADEMNKLLLAARPSPGIRLLVDLGLMGHIVPEILPMIGMKQGSEYHFKDVYTHVLQVLDQTPATLALRWGALLHDIAKPATFSIVDGKVHFYGHETLGATMARGILKRLRFDHAFIDDVGDLVAKHMRINTYSGWTDGAVRRFMREAGGQLENLFALSRADVTSQRPERVQAVLRGVDELEQRVATIAAQEEVAKLRSPLDGNDLMVLFDRPAGPWIRPIKDYLLDLVLDGQLGQDDRETGIALARAYVARHGFEDGAARRGATP